MANKKKGKGIKRIGGDEIGKNPRKSGNNKDNTAKVILIFLISLVVVFGLIISIRYFPHKAKNVTREFNGFIFENVEGLWVTEFQKDNTLYQINLHYAPWELDDVSVKGDPYIFTELMSKYNRTGVYVTFNPSSNNNPYAALAYAELKMSLERALGIKPILSCTSNTTEDCAKRPIIDPYSECKKRESMIFFIDVNSSIGSPEVAEYLNCYVIRGNGVSSTNMTIVKAADKFVYILNQIMNAESGPAQDN